MIRILAFAGSARKDSFNKIILKVAAQGATEAGAKVTLIDLADFAMPLMDEDLEKKLGIPANALKFKQLLNEHDGLLIASPEHNSAYSALLKNTIDWASRRADGEKPMESFKGKVAGIMAASPGALGGLRGLVPLRMLLENIGVMVLPNQKAVAKITALLDEENKIDDEQTQVGLKRIGKELAETLAKLQR
ncbi:NADPH-dependent FMN reductase [Flavobacterium sp. W21_SRS_FM6]|uniref:NADPH-dependent FMN reductase n=1 Tax=Flavobacterium sp. W21_SRS_FM6 TaxID=3240268 RepID=UPI003F916958